jgi:hypothetical protein
MYIPRNVRQLCPATIKDSADHLQVDEGVKGNIFFVDFFNFYLKATYLIKYYSLIRKKLHSIVYRKKKKFFW